MTGFVLAGGASSRMGRDKALVDVEGVALALRVARVLEEGGCKPVVLVGSQPELASLGLPVLPDPPGEPHALRGVAAALASCKTGLALICPCDLVGLTADDVETMLDEEGPCVSSSPLLAVLHRKDAGRAARFAAEGRSARQFVSGMPRVELPDSALVNLNSEDDLESWLASDGD